MLVRASWLVLAVVLVPSAAALPGGIPSPVTLEPPAAPLCFEWSVGESEGPPTPPPPPQGPPPQHPPPENDSWFQLRATSSPDACVAPVVDACAQAQLRCCGGPAPVCEPSVLLAGGPMGQYGVILDDHHAYCVTYSATGSASVVVTDRPCWEPHDP